MKVSLQTDDTLDTQNIQGSAFRWVQGFVNVVAAVAYHFCLALPTEFTKPGDHLLAEPCIIYNMYTQLPFIRDSVDFILVCPKKLSTYCARIKY